MTPVTNDLPKKAVPPHPSFREALAVWAKIGLLSFGGPAGQIALMHKELVDERRWISESRFLHALNYCMLLPGPEAQQLAVYIGWLLHGTRGGIVAGTLFVLPGFLVICALSAAYALFQRTDWLQNLFFGLKAAVLAIVLEALVRVASRALKTPFTRLLAAVAFICLFFLALPFPLVIAAAGICGYLVARTSPGLLQPPVGHKAHAPDMPSVIGDAFPDRRRRFGATVGIVIAGAVLWAAPFVVLMLLPEGPGAFAAIGVFFSKMAVVTFGGAYAVLAYVAQQAVETYHWLKPGEMLDGLALAETTPGPLVLVLSFVGFLAAFRDTAGLDPLAAGLLGAFLTTWVTFVPCFLWIFLGAPYVERLRANAALSGALAAISAAVVGVILNLAVWFGLHVLFREVGSLRLGPISMALPEPGSLDALSLLLTVAAAVMLFRLRLGIVYTLLVCAVAGFALNALI
ncbi:chromate efflux transporter [Mycoplana ramosa]|uniref:Chromate efflux transporter n=1 Tax=Mycoplana ramosa TaxID=40837 RepID=A0ABW3YU88_MYCRA